MHFPSRRFDKKKFYYFLRVIIQGGGSKKTDVINGQFPERKDLH